jgi:hypothetical protein
MRTLSRSEEFGASDSSRFSAMNSEAAVLITVNLVGPDEVRSTVTISEDATVRDVATFEYHLFWWSLKRNGTNVPFTARVLDGDVVNVEDRANQ